jgi:hypothetical protein
MSMETAAHGKQTIVALTADDDRFAPARRSALDLAREAGAELILYDWDAAMVLEDPLPSFWSADREDPIPDRLDEAALEAAGRHHIAKQVRQASESGVVTTAWLPSSHEPSDLLAYAKDHAALAIVVPGGLVEEGVAEAIAEAAEESETPQSDAPAGERGSGRIKVVIV